CALIARLQAKDPADRFQSAREVADLLGQHLAHLQQPGQGAMPRVAEKPPARPVRKRRWAGPLAASLLLLGLGGGLFLAYQAGWLFRSPEPSQAPDPIAGPRPVYQSKPARAWVGDLDDKDPKTQEKAYHALVAIGKEGVPYLVIAVQKGTVQGQVLAAKALGAVGPDAGAAVGDLKNLLQADNARVRVAAASALWSITQDSEAVTQTLIGALAVRDKEARQAAAETRAAIGPKARAAVPALANVLTDKEKHVRKAAVLALGNIGPKEVVLGPLSGMLSDEQRDVRVSAAQVLRKLDPAAKEPVLVLVKAASVGSERILEKIGPEAKSAVPDLVSLLKNESTDVRKAAAITLGRIGPGAKSVAPALVEALADHELRREADEALERIDPEPAAVLASFTKALGSKREPLDDVRVESAAKRVLQKIGAKDAALVPQLLEMVSSMKIKNDIVDGVLEEGFYA